MRVDPKSIKDKADARRYRERVRVLGMWQIPFILAIIGFGMTVISVLLIDERTKLHGPFVLAYSVGGKWGVALLWLVFTAIFVWLLFKSIRIKRTGKI